ncbi:tRNA threonylcarbamoyladenosine dehydratase [Ectothiorhodospira lacustris]|uniref:tRNA threonylcarbamoyladenosine dehydratase n=1 Tax=Ectothiorhodospira lacustris TaxID=2899127 RepID=UPI001EE8F3B6|nr:tRNA threonylcarbamoyladenosine dehydratase [Ectothiorhodospira lacustris]MCG5500704.1 tRNA threonylcarbamoyladenosine dehydratase [Ectothiorhodospira lacustris]MCG5509077.1 tRNA threonylcarbamoyladenosine dehydratase [Ectothiorhodospira lacustris]MCG5520868.1 tRNA threonylcarbamoyladenosine dehydratase [Ectothiorhodospira lacustris]
MNHRNPLHERTELLIGPEGLEQFARRHVFIAGLGGVGGSAAEAIARAGIGRITLLDHDRVGPSNMNRQLVALHSTLGQSKAEVMAARIRDINPALTVTVLGDFLTPDNVHALLPVDVDYVLDCIDSIACKAALVHVCQQRGVPIISSMGAGGRLDPTAVRIGPLGGTDKCPLAREMRKRLRRLGAHLDYPVVHSTETAIKGTEHRPIEGPVSGRARAVNGTISYMPGLFGLMLAGHVIQNLIPARQQGA